MELSKVSGKLAIVLSYRIEESGEAFNKIVSGSLKDIFGLEEAKYIATRIQLLYLFPQAKQFREILKANWKDEYNKVCDLESDWELIGKATMWLPKLALITLQTALELGRKVKDLIEELKTEDIDNAGQYALVYEGMSPEEAVNAMKINISYVQSYVRAIYDRLYEKYGPLFTALTLLQGPIAIDILREFLAEYSLSKVEIDERIRMLKRAKGIVVVGREEWVDGERETLSLQDMWREQLQVLEVIESIDRDLKRERDDVAEKLLMIVTNYAKRYDYYTFGMSLNAMCLLRRIYEEYLSTIDKLKVIDIEKLYRVFRATVFWCKLASQYPRMVDEILRLLSDDVKKIFADDKIYESLYKYTIERYGEEEWLKLLIRTIDSIGFLAAVKAASAPSAIDTLIEPYSVLRNLLDIIWNKIKLEIYEKPALVIGYVSAISSLLSLLHYRSHQTPSAIEENLLFTRLQATLEYMFNELKQCKQRTICEELFAITFLEIDPDVLPELLKAIKPLASWAIRFLEGWLEMRDEYPASARLYLKLIGVPPEMWNRYKINRLATLYYALGKYNIDLGALDKAEKLFRRAWWIAWNAAWRLTSTEVINVLISWTWYVRTLFLSYGLKTFNQIIEYPYVKSLSFNIDDRATRKNTIIDAYADIWKWINRTGFIYFMHDFIHDRLLGDIIAVYILCKKRLPIPEEIGFNYENNILNLFRSPMDASLNQGFLIVASNVLNIDIKLDKNEVITKLKNSIEEYKGFMIADIVQIMIYLINGEIDHAINYIKRIEEKLADLQGEILYRLLQNLRLTLERDRKLTENVLEWLTRIYFYLT